MKRRDYVVIIGLVVIALIAQAALHGRESAGMAVISVSGKIASKLPLGEDGRSLGVGALGPYEVRCEGGAVYMVSSTCADGLCVRQGAIRMAGQAIICLPNQVAVRLSGDTRGGMDAVAR